MQYFRMPIEIESPEELGYQNIKINLAESSVAEMNLSQLSLDLSQIKLEYTPHRGHYGLRNLIAQEGDGLVPDNVLLTGGAAMALFIVHTCLLRKNDQVVVLHPNYSSNLAVPQAIGCDISPCMLELKDKWDLDLDALHKQIKPSTRLLSLTYPHNPTGKILTDEMIRQLIRIVEQYDLYCLIDETYRDACFKTTYPLVAGYHPRIISVLSFSKGYGLPGIRIGALICRDQTLMSQFLAAKEMIQICNPPLEEAIAYHVYRQKSTYLNPINLAAQANLEILKSWLSRETRVEAVLPGGGVVCYARITKELDYTRFHRVLLDDFGTLTGPGHWFGMSDQYFRIGFGYPYPAQLEKGLTNISETLDFLGSQS
ncbi:MAG: pyridoxal phosphate-dependent aminotransferase [Saprospiraceae bacterium]|nr:pyridoxal phosphate-dependent aminotransferase [Saprospiraceae bacterium]